MCMSVILKINIPKRKHLISGKKKYFQVYLIKLVNNRIFYIVLSYMVNFEHVVVRSSMTYH